MYGFHPANLALRLILELSALTAIGFGAYAMADGPLAWLLAIGLPVVAAVIWGTFNVPGDRSRSGEAPVPVPGLVRLLIELAFFAVAIALLSRVSNSLAIAFGLAVVAHYALSIDRIRWLLGN